MIDTIKDYIFPKRFSILAYVCVIIHFHCGVLLTAITTAVRLGETEKFSCRVDTNFATHKTYVEKTCFSLYDDTYNSPVRFYAFVVLNFGSVVLVSVIYSLAVRNRIDETERYVAGRDESQTGGKKGSDEPGGKTFYVFYFYFIHLVARLMLGILFTILQHSVLYPSGFDSQFSCVYEDIKQAEHNITAAQNASINTESSHVTCTNSAAKEKQFWGTILSVCNVIFAIITLAELIYLISYRFPFFNTQSNVAWSCDSQFITEYFLRKQYIPSEDDMFTGVDNCTLSSIDIYKQKVLKDSLIDINYGANVSLNVMFIDVVIQTGQAAHKFSKGMKRHEIYDVYMEVPKHSIPVKEIKDLFYPNKDTKGISSRTILALGRPGIGKTLLTRKILYDWANDVDKFYQEKMIFLFKLRCFNFTEFQSLTLKKFLQFGTQLNEDEFESIFEEIMHNSRKIILIFDGLDELCSNLKEFEDYIDRSKIYPNNPDILMSAMFLFIKIMLGDFIKEATVLVTSRPTASDVCSKFKFDRRVEMDDTFTGVDNCTLSSSDIYKQNVLKDPLIDINYGANVSLNDMFIEVIIQTEQAPHKFLKGMSRHEIYEVYMEVPKHSIPVKEIKDLFYPNKDTKGIFPRTILALGRPGIGKTVLTRKILHDWANDVDVFYKDKITFLFKLRCFNFSELQSLTLKKFLQFGTQLNEDEFESIFEEIIHNSRKIILILDGLDELCSNLKEFEDYIDRSKIYPNNPDIPMSAMFFFIKIMLGDLIKNATVLVTSRPTASDVCSKLKFDRTVEIIGFTADKIEKYVEQFCVNHQQENLKPKIWNHINSSPEIKNLCYIPVNSFIVCVTLLKSLTDPANDNPLPTTLTELYQAALVYFHKNHDKSKDCYENVIKELQFLAFKGMENDKLIFDDELVNEQMKESGLLHCLPAAIFQIQTQVCFIHLTVQEFLAAKYIVETKEPKDIKKFISSHVEHGKWHLVLQFLAGLLGRKMKMFDQYRSCVLVFTEHLSFKIKDEDTVLGFDDEHVNHILVMKCLRETEDEDIAKDAALTPALKTVTWIQAEGGPLLGPSEYAAMIFVCKHLNFLTSLTFERIPGLDCFLEVLKLLQERCIHKLSLELSSSWCESPVHFQHVISALADSECRINHKHSKLTLLKLRDFNIADAGVSTVTEFLCKNAHQICLQELDLRDNKITSRGISKFCDVLGHEVFNMLMYLNLDWNPVGDDGIRILCEALRREKHRLQRLSIGKCSLTTESIFALVEVLSDKHCEITELVLNDNKIGDKGAQTLFAALELEQCCLTQLNLKSCSLTEECMAALSEVLCGLIMLNLSNNKVGDEGMRMLCSAFTKEQCKLTMLFVRGCLLTDECLPSFCEVLREERCRLTWLDVMFNDFTDKYLSLLSDTLQLEHCCLEFLNITSNHLTKKGEKLLKDVENSKYCKARRLKILSKN